MTEGCTQELLDYVTALNLKGYGTEYIGHILSVNVEIISRILNDNLLGELE